MGIDQNLTTCNGAKGDASSPRTARTRWKRQEAPLEETSERNRKVLFTHKKSLTDGDERLPFFFSFLFLFLFHACQSVREMSFSLGLLFFRVCANESHEISVRICENMFSRLVKKLPLRGAPPFFLLFKTLLMLKNFRLCFVKYKTCMRFSFPLKDLRFFSSASRFCLRWRPPVQRTLVLKFSLIRTYAWF